MSTPKGYLFGALSPDVSVFPVYRRLRLDDEIIHVLRTWSVVPSVTHPLGPATVLPRPAPLYFAHVLRGQEGTTAAAHAAGTEEEWDPE